MIKKFNLQNFNSGRAQNRLMIIDKNSFLKQSLIKVKIYYQVVMFETPFCLGSISGSISKTLQMINALFIFISW